MDEFLVWLKDLAQSWWLPLAMWAWLWWRMSRLEEKFEEMRVAAVLSDRGRYSSGEEPRP